VGSAVKKIVFMGCAGRRMLDILNTLSHDKKFFWYDVFDDAARKAVEITDEGTTCLMSPAAASYGMFNNFKERGDRFVQIIKAEV